MKQLTELKDGQKVLVAFTVNIDYENEKAKYELFDNNNRMIIHLYNDFKDSNEDLQPQEIYDFDEVMNQNKSNQFAKNISARDLFDSIWKTNDIDLSEFTINGNSAISLMEQFLEMNLSKKSEPISREEFRKKISDLLSKYNNEITYTTTIFLNDIYDLFQSYHLESFTPEIGKEYDFSTDNEIWLKDRLRSFNTDVYSHIGFKYIRPIQQSEEELKAIELLKNLGYEINKK